MEAYKEADRLATEAEDLINRLRLARETEQDPQRITKIRRCRVAAWARWRRRCGKWSIALHALEAN